MILWHVHTPAEAQSLYFTGDFNKFVASDGTVVNISGIAEWFGGSAAALGQGISLPAEGRTLDYNTALAGLYVGGSFNVANGEGVSRLSFIHEQQMQEVDKGLSHTVYTAKVHQATGHVYVGGVFFDATGIPVGHITVWNGSTWDTMAGGVAIPKQCRADGTVVEVREAAVLALALAESDSPLHPRVYAGGRFMTAGGVAAHHIAVYDQQTQAWSSLCRADPPTRCDNNGIGEGVNSDGGVGALEYVFALALDAASNRLFVGGVFGAAGQKFASIQSLAVYNISSGEWGLVGGGIAGTNPTVNALQIASQKLYVGGFFTAVGKQNEDLFVTGVTSPNIAAYSLVTGDWEALGGGLPGAVVNALSVGTSGTVYVGGGFTSVNSQPAAGLAVYNGDGWVPYGGRLESETGGAGAVYAVLHLDQRLPEVQPARVFTGTSARLQVPCLHAAVAVWVCAVLWSTRVA